MRPNEKRTGPSLAGWNQSFLARRPGYAQRLGGSLLANFRVVSVAGVAGIAGFRPIWGIGIHGSIKLRVDWNVRIGRGVDLGIWTSDGTTIFSNNGATVRHTAVITWGDSGDIWLPCLRYV
jgi:hypothetical protein